MTSQHFLQDIGLSHNCYPEILIGPTGSIVATQMPLIRVIEEMESIRDRRRRGGVIPYGIDNEGKLWFGTGIDAKYGDITDFGGSIEKEDDDYIETAMREFEQESIGSFGQFYKEDFYGHYVVMTKRIVIIFYFLGKIDENYMKKVSNCFDHLLPLQKDPKRKEVSNIFWYEGTNLREIASYNRNEGNRAVFRQIRSHIVTFLNFRLNSEK